MSPPPPPPARNAKAAKPVKGQPASGKKASSITTGPYDRFGLIGNPFRDLSSESLADVEVFHVNLAVDESLAPIKEEVLAQENKALVALVGNLGAGKTERLLLASAEGTARGAFVVYFDVAEKVSWALPDLARKVLESSTLSGFAKFFSSPAWYRDLAALAKPGLKGIDPIRTGKAIAAALNANAPAFLLLNDFHNLATVPEAEAFAKMLQELADAIRPGVLVMFGSFPGYYAALSKRHPALSSRINRTVFLPTLSNDEAGLMLAKKLLAKRMVEDLDPLFPFDRDAIEAMNASALGNPRRLIEIADRALEYAAVHRSYRITVETVRIALAARETPPVTAPPAPEPQQQAPPAAATTPVS